MTYDPSIRSLLATLIGMMISVLIDIDSASAQDTGQPEQFYGAPTGWTVEEDGAVASTLISSVNSSGFVQFYCRQRLIGFRISLFARKPDQAAIAHDGLLHVYPALAEPGDPLLAQFRVRFRGPGVFYSTRFRYPGRDQPARFLNLVRDYPTGLQLQMIQLRHDRFTQSRRIDLYLPGIANGDGVPMEIALAVVEETCRRPP